MTGEKGALDRERERLAELRSYAVLDTPPEADFDDLVQLASEICGVPIALVSLVDEKRQWFKAKVGLTVDETDRNVAFCSHTIQQDDIFTIEDASHDARFAGNPLVTGDPHIRFYAGAPLRPRTGHALGSLCVIDRVPRELTPMQRNALVVLARQATMQLELQRAVHALVRREAEVVQQRDAIVRLQAQRERLVSHLVHDLRSPLSSIALNARVAGEGAADDDAREIAADIAAAATRMDGMMTDMLRVARADDAMLVPVLGVVDLASLFAEAADTVRAATGAGAIDVDIRPGASVHADRPLVRRVLENLLVNAFKYGAGHVTLSAKGSLEEGVRIDVADDGPGIPAAYHEKIFDRYARLERDFTTHARVGEGLGLALCRLAMEAHRGSIHVEDREPRGAVFHLVFPPYEEG